MYVNNLTLERIFNGQSPGLPCWYTQNSDNIKIYISQIND